MNTIIFKFFIVFDAKHSLYLDVVNDPMCKKLLCPHDIIIQRDFIIYDILKRRELLFIIFFYTSASNHNFPQPHYLDILNLWIGNVMQRFLFVNRSFFSWRRPTHSLWNLYDIDRREKDGLEGWHLRTAFTHTIMSQAAKNFFHMTWLMSWLVEL